MSQREVYEILNKNKGKWFNTILLREKYGLSTNIASRGISALCKNYPNVIEIKSKPIKIGTGYKHIKFIRLV